MNRVKIFFCFLFLAITHTGFSQPKVITDFNKGWKFFLGNDSAAINPNYNDAQWRKLNLPHDWSIEGDFSKSNPATNQGGALPGGIGWYRKTFVLTAGIKNKNISIEFDGVYRNSEVWINGHYLGKRPYGYSSFSYDITRFLNKAPEKNVISVKVDNSQQPNSRWYSGSGIYRDVRLVIKNKIAFKENGVYIIPELNGQEASLNIQAWIKATAENKALFSVQYELLDGNGKMIKDESYHTMVMNNLQGTETKYLFTYQFKNPTLWSVHNPYLYTLKAKLLVDGKLTDEVVVRLGVRQFSFDASKGFFLNNQSLKIKGVCMHHDLGALGAAFNIAAAKRQLKILKDMGCNAIRTAHNPPAPQLLDLCDEMGFLVMDEAFDMWQKRKNKFDYSKDFAAWYKKDLEDMVVRDRNHPSIFMWSIGNEIREQFDSSAKVFTKELVDIVKAFDPTRPVTSAMTETHPEKNFIAQSNALDVLGFNYKDYDYDSLLIRFPGKELIASETVSGLATRGVYQFPSDTNRIWPPSYKVQDTFTGNKDFTCAAYDNTFAYWGNTHEKAWAAVKKRDFIAGTFVWSGFDFLGEPVPYQWPARSSYYGIIDLAGFTKDVYYMYQSEWTDKPVLHIFPHWNWKPGQVVDVWAYYNNADEVELFLNGKSLGVKKKMNDDLHVMWRIPFEPGTLKAVSRKNGKVVLTKEIHTAGAATKLALTADNQRIHADGKDLSYVTVKVLDTAGNLVPDADNTIQWSVEGAGEIAATDNGYEADLTPFKSKERRCWKGLGLAIIQSNGKPGEIIVTAKSEGMTPVRIVLHTN
ncbi:MAG: glycoside hydrolase family 2 TIM barrel-domain containing protein [Chitinophagaceae bacterium]